MSRISASLRFQQVASLVLIALLWRATGLGQVTTFEVQATDGIALGPDGAMWFTDLAFDNIGRIEESGVVTLFSLPRGGSFGGLLLPAGIALGPDGNLWFTESGSPSSIGRITTAGNVTEFALPTAASRPYGIVSGPDGNLWFTEQSSNQIGRITTSGVLAEFPVPTANAGLSGIAAGPDGNLWFVETTGNKIGRITTAGVVTEFSLPNADSRPTAIAAGLDGNLWFTESFAARVGRITPTGDIAEFPVSGVTVGVAAGTDGNLWFTSSQTLRRVTTSGVVTEFSIPLYHPSPLGIAVAPDGALWMTDNINGFAAQIIRFSLDTSSCVADATTICLNRGRFRVTTAWRKNDGTTGQGNGVALTTASGYFWFFDAPNVELVVKVLDGCSSGETYWFFAAGLTNIEVTTTVTDTHTGFSRTYTNPLGTPFAPIQDVSTFSTCPRQ